MWIKYYTQNFRGLCCFIEKPHGDFVYFSLFQFLDILEWAEIFVSNLVVCVILLILAKLRTLIGEYWLCRNNIGLCTMHAWVCVEGWGGGCAFMLFKPFVCVWVRVHVERERERERDREREREMQSWKVDLILLHKFVYLRFILCDPRVNNWSKSYVVLKVSLCVF